MCKYPGGNEHKRVLKGSPGKGQMVNSLGFMDHGICINPCKCQCRCKSSHRQYISTRAWPVPLKLFTEIGPGCR